MNPRKKTPSKARATPKARWWAAGAVAVALVVGILIWRHKTARPVTSGPSAAVSNRSPQFPGGSLLDQVVPKASGPGNPDASGPVPTTAQLEKQFSVIIQNQEQVEELKLRSTAAMERGKQDLVKETADQGKELISLLGLRMSALQADLDAARRAKPQDPTVQWLTGELLLIAGGEPQEIRPYFAKAIDAGLKQPQLFTSLAKVEFDSNRFQAAYGYARKALEEDPHSRAVWETYMRAGFALERFQEVVQGLDQAFPKEKPPWAGTMRKSARRLVDQWSQELALRHTEEKAGNLPLVKLTIEHRAFATNTAAEGTPGKKRGGGEKSTGRGEVEIELFEDQAPATVANFLNLAEHGFYDGTRFHWSEAGRMVVGGDPNTKLENRDQDGSGGPGYSIPDEAKSPSARGHFRGSVSLVQHGPRTAGSQFFITLVPCPEFNGRFAVFGRVIAGQDVVDQVTEGRTNLEVGKFGKIIPGDVVVHGEVVRKRAHKYEVTKLPP